MSLLVSIDPGKNGCGLAAFDALELVHAEYSSGLGGQICPLMEPVHGVEEAFKGLCEAFGPRSIETLLVEVPQVYETKHQKGDQQDLIDLAVVVGGILAAARTYARSALIVRPHQWKGTTPKEITEQRVRKLLSPEEFGRIDWPRATGLHHNIFDAIGIGLWRLRN